MRKSDNSIEVKFGSPEVIPILRGMMKLNI